MKKTIRLTEDELRNVVTESVNRVLNEVSDSLLVRAMNASKDKVADYNEKYGQSSYPAYVASKQSDFFDNEYKKRFDNANLKRKGRMEKMKIDATNKRTNSTAGERKRQMEKEINGDTKAGGKKKGFFGRFFK